MKLIVYKPSVDSSWPLALQLLFEDFSRFGRWLLLSLERLEIPFEVVDSHDELVERANSCVIENEQISLLCICFPHQIPLDIQGRKLAAIPRMFDTYSAEAGYLMPFEVWPKVLAAVDDVLVPSVLVEKKVRAIIGSQTQVHVLVPAVPSINISEILSGEPAASHSPTIVCGTDMFMSTMDGNWNSVYEPPANVIERFVQRELDLPLRHWSLGDPAQSGVWAIGFYPSDLWGAWAQLKSASVLLPVFVTGPIHVIIELQGSGKNVGREITIRFGDEERHVVLTSFLEAMHFEFHPNIPTNQIHFEGYELDSETDQRGLGVGVSSISLVRSTQWTGSKLSWSASKNDTKQLSLIGFHLGDKWGSWAKTKEAFVLLPVEVSGRIRLLINLAGCGENIGRTINIRIGENTFPVLLESDIREYCFEFNVAIATDRVFFQGFEIDQSIDPRGLGFGIEFIQINRLADIGLQSFEWNVNSAEIKSVDLFGFHPAEAWGAWARSLNARILLSSAVTGKQIVAVSLLGSGANIERQITIRLGNETRHVQLPSSPKEFLLEFDVNEPTNSLCFEDYEIDQLSDGRGLGVGIVGVRLSRPLGVLGKVRRRIGSNQPIVEANLTQEASGEIVSNKIPAKANLEMQGKVFVLVVRPSDLIANQWIEIIKNFALVYESRHDTHLVVVCPSSWITTFLLPVSQFIDRLSSKKVNIHFSFLDCLDNEFKELCTHPNVSLVLREDGLDFEMAGVVLANTTVTIGPSSGLTTESDGIQPSVVVEVLAQPAQLIGGTKSPIALGFLYDNSSLCLSFKKADQLIGQRTHDGVRSVENSLFNQQLKNIFVDVHHV